MKLFFGDTPVGGEVDLADFDALKNDVAGKYDKGDESAIPDGKRDYADAAAMESAVKGNTNDISSLQDDFQDLITALEGFDGSQLEVELSGYFKKYGKGDDDQEALIYDSAAKMGVVVQSNEQAIIDNANAITAGDLDTLQKAKDHADAQDVINLQSAKTYADTKDTETLALAKDHSDANDTVTLGAANTYTDEKIAAIPGVDGLQDFEDKVDEL
ncbi:MAG: hypothetical protein EB168_11070, partial [Euryarchaeota archaeon]|nr:hypothetical protein [Euryarchaeota archaeon]